MLFKSDILEKIKKGEVKLALRQWKRPTVKLGGTLITPVGQLSIQQIDEIQFKDLNEHLAKQAGYDSMNSLLKMLKPKEYLPISIIYFELIGEDPRIALRSNDISQQEIDDIIKKLEGMDKRSKYGPWTLKTLQIIHDQPATLSTTLANQLGFEKSWLKPQIRKLKALGLTISLDVGYKLSLRGELMLKVLIKGSWV